MAELLLCHAVLLELERRAPKHGVFAHMRTACVAIDWHAKVSTFDGEQTNKLDFV